MKIRNGFVSNSSSASFVIVKSVLTDEQKEVLLSFSNDTSNLGYKRNEEYHKILDDMIENGDIDSWTIHEKKYFIDGWTSINNCPLMDFLNKIGVDPEAVATEYMG